MTTPRRRPTGAKLLKTLRRGAKRGHKKESQQFAVKRMMKRMGIA